MPELGRVGLVVAGAGARGAYEAGALAALLPRLESEGTLPRVLVGTSAGSINVAYLAAKLHLGAEAATDGLVELWQSLDKRELTGWLAVTAVPALIGYAGRIFYLPTGSGSLANFGRFPERLDEAIGDWGQIRSNIDAGVIDAVGVVATAASTGGSVVFLEAGDTVQVPPLDEASGILYAPAEISHDHVLASSSIPGFFPAWEVAEPADASGWYWDGGSRLNTPLKPAIEINIDRLVIVSTGPPRHPAPVAGGNSKKPDFDDALLHLIQATLDDRLIEDLHSLVRVNELVVASGAETLADHRRYEYIFAGPEQHGVIGRAAAEILREQYGSPLRAFDDFAVLGRLLGRQGPEGAELQSYLLFDSNFLTRLVELGREAGERAVQGGWLLDALPAAWHT